MSYVDPTTLTWIKQQIQTKEAQLDAANTAYQAALENSEVQTYGFDSGEGRQNTTRRKPAEISQEITRLEAQLNRLYNRLNGTGLCTLNLRRVGR